MQKPFFLGFNHHFSTKSARQLMTVCISFFVYLMPHLLMAEALVYRCERLFGSTRFSELRPVRIFKPKRTKIFHLQPGQHLKVEIGSRQYELYYIGRENDHGREALLFAGGYFSSSFFHIRASEIEGFSGFRFREDDLLISPTNQGRNNTCAAHAVGACVAAHASSLEPAEVVPMDSRSIEKKRDMIIRKAIETIYNNDQEFVSFQQRVERVLNENGMDSRSFLLDGEKKFDQLVELLQNNHPVYLSFRSKHNDYYRSHETVKTASVSRTAKTSRPPYFHVDNYDPYEIAQYHAVVLLKAFEIEGSQAILVLDSSIGEYRIWRWSDIVKTSGREPHLVIVPGEKEKQAVAGIPQSTLDSLMYHKGRSGIVDFMSDNPKRVWQVENVDAWFHQPVLGQWVLMTKHLGFVHYGSGSDVIVGKVSRFGIRDDGLRFIEYQPYQYNRLNVDRDPKSFRGSVEYLFESQLPQIKSIYLLANFGSDSFQALQRADAGEMITIDWYEFPHSKPKKVVGPILSVSLDSVKIFDERKSKVIELLEGDFIKNLKFQRTQDLEKNKLRFSQALKEVLLNRHRREGYSDIHVLDDFARQLQVSRLVYAPSIYSEGFDFSKLSRRSRVIIFLTDSFVLSGEGINAKRSAIGTISEIEKDSFVFTLSTEKRLRLVPQNIAAIFALP